MISVLFAVGLVAMNVFMLFMIRRRRTVPLWCYLNIGISGYNFMLLWVHGWLGVAVGVMFRLCVLGFTIDICIDTWKDMKERRKVEKRLREQYKSLEAHLEEFAAQWRQSQISEATSDVFQDELLRYQYEPLQAQESRVM